MMMMMKGKFGKGKGKGSSVSIGWYCNAHLSWFSGATESPELRQARKWTQAASHPNLREPCFGGGAGVERQLALKYLQGLRRRSYCGSSEIAIFFRVSASLMMCSALCTPAVQLRNGTCL